MRPLGLRGERRNRANTELFDDSLDLALRFAAGQFIFNGGLFGGSAEWYAGRIENVW